MHETGEGGAPGPRDLNIPILHTALRMVVVYDNANAAALSSVFWLGLWLRLWLWLWLWLWLGLELELELGLVWLFFAVDIERF